MISCHHDLYDDRIYWKEAISLKNHGYEVIHVAVGAEDRDFLSEQGIRMILLKKDRFFRNPYLDILYHKLSFKPDIYRRLFEVCASYRADAYHYHDIQINRISKQLKELSHRPRVIYDVHEDYADLIRSSHPNYGLKWILASIYAPLLNHLELSRAKNCDVIIAAVDHLYNKFNKPGIGAKVHVIYNFTNLSPGSIKPFREKHYDAMYCGQINKNRGILQILAAVRILKKRMPDIRILLIGPVPDPGFKAFIHRMIATDTLHENVILHEAVPYSQMEGFFRDSRIGLGVFLPVSYFFYGIQIKTFEYMAFGMPVVCSNFGTMNRFITESNAGIPVNPLSPEEISNAIYRILHDEELYMKLGGNGMKAVKERYSWTSEEKKLVNIYHVLFSHENHPVTGKKIG
jgi:glycosyltransferase involved in cell wall biosynthesis